MSVKFEDNTSATITDFTPNTLVVGQNTVTFTYNNRQYYTTVNYAPAAQYALTLNKATLEDASAQGQLQADGKTVMRVEAYINVPAGENANDFTGQAEFWSKNGLVSAQGVAAFDKGKAVFNVTLPNSKVDIQDQIKVVLKETQNQDLKGLETQTINLTYKAYIPGGGVVDQKVYTVDSVKSADLADRVTINVANVANSDLETVKAAILKQIKVYNSNNLANPIDLVKITDATVTGNQGATDASYAFTALLDLKSYNNQGYGATEEVSRLFLAENALTDNQYNYYSVGASADDIRLMQDAASTDNKFMVIDKYIPRIETVKAPKSKADGNMTLPANTLMAVFSEPVNRLTAENPQNWVLNGHKLTTADVRYVRAMDIFDQETIVNNIDGKYLLNFDDAKNIRNGAERNLVFISLTNSAANQYLKDGENLLQARSVADVAGLTDLSDNNRITTQDFLFDYAKPVVDPDLAIEKESPEQYTLKLSQPLYTDENSSIPFVMFDATNMAQNVKVELLSDPLRALVADVTNVSRIVPCDTPNHDEFVLELTQDWTKILNAPTAYHNKWFRVTVNQKVYDELGVLVYDPALPSSDTNKPIFAEVQVPEDTTSPAIKVAAGNKVVEFLGSTGVEEGLAVYTNAATYGNMAITMTEPVQLYHKNAGDIMNMAPGYTPSTMQIGADGVPVPTFEYVKITNTDPNPLYSVGQKVDGEIFGTPIDEHDVQFNVKPVSTLDNGKWKLVVRQISDDVGNTMATEEIPFIVGTVNLVDRVDPYVIWSYADDDKVVNGEMNDYVYVLYSRQMSADALRAATYDINGKQVTQDADITSQDLVLFQNMAGDKYYGLKYGGVEYKPYWKGQFVTIKLPADFIVGGDDIDGDRDGKFRKNVLTIPTTLTAKDDNDPITIDTLLFDNNNNDNQFELTFEKNYGVNGISRNDHYVPAITYNANINYQTYSGANVVVPVGPEAVEDDRVAGLTPGMDLLMVTLANVDDPSQYDVFFGATKFNFANGKFAAEVPAGTQVSELTISEKQAPPPVIEPVAVEDVREAGLTPGMDLLMVTLANVDEPSQYDVFFGATKFTFANGKFAAEVPTGTAVSALTIVKK